MEHVTEECTCSGKECRVCQKVKCVGKYGKDRRMKDGLEYRCKSCESERTIRRSKQKPRKRRHNPQVDKRYEEKHPERRGKYREKVNECGKRWRANHPDYFPARRAHMISSGGSHTAEEWENLKAKYDYRCLCCGKREPNIKLTEDHIIPVTQGGSSDINNIQPLCRPCNSRKGAKCTDFRPETLDKLMTS